MTEINKAGETHSLGHIDIPQGQYRDQIDALTDAVRQLGGKAEIEGGSTVVNDPLNAPYVLYVNSYTGSDDFVGGEYATADDGTFEQKMRRISQQRLECGYTEARPFKTINRAAIEAGIITSKDYLDLPGNLCGDLVTIVVSSGVHDVINGPGTPFSAGDFPDVGGKQQFTKSKLKKFNAADGGVILPRGCSVVSMDLRKCNLRPTYVPNFNEERADYSNRSSIFRVTGTGYYYGFTFLDKKDYTESHHLLDTFSFAGRARVDEFYKKILSAFGASTGVSTFARTRDSEVQIVGPQPLPGFQDEKTDTVESASPYIYNCSIRSVYGLCGIFANGADVEGFKSMVVAQYTAISMQKDMRCWQRYKSGAWSTINQSDYDKYIDETPDNVRMDPRYRSIHIRCVNRAIIQEVSVFAIGQGVHHAVSSGGELTVTNSNSNFGGVCALADGFVDYSFDTDKNWNVGFIKVAENIEALSGQVSNYFLGTIIDSEGNGATNISLEEELEGEEENRPDVLAIDGFSLDNYGGTNLLWAENPNGPDYFAPLADRAWRTSSKDIIRISESFVSAVDEFPPTDDPTSALPPIAGMRVYVRRLRDTRTVDQRRYSLICNNTATDSRNIVRDYGLQTDTASSSIDTEIDEKEPIVVGTIAIKKAEGGVQRTNEIELRRAAASARWDKKGAYIGTDEDGDGGYHQANNYYRPGDVVRYANKHWKCTVEHIAEAFDDSKWDECLVHMHEDYAAEDYFKNVQPIIYFDKDQDETNSDPLLGYGVNALSNDDELQRQVRTATDYLGLFSFFRSLGFGKVEAHNILAPKPDADRIINPNSAFDGISQPGGAANSWDNWEIQFRRPSNIRLFGHAFEWAGQLNYTKALPQYQRDLSASNKFSYFFTNSMGGRCYVSGFNEEGFGVSAAGLTDLQTGETLSPEGIGADRDPNQPVTFNGDVLIQGMLTVNEIDSNQVSLVKNHRDNGNEPSAGRGMSWIAPMQNITDVNPEQGLELNDRNEAGEFNGSFNATGYTGPSFVTPYYLDTWRSRNRLLGSQPGPVYIFINPRAVKPLSNEITSPTDNESTNWDATTVEELINNPPLTPSSACKSIRLAVEYANATLNTATAIVYNCGCGLYLEDYGTIVFEHRASIVGYNFATNKFADDANETPWLGTTNNEKGNTGSLGRFPEGSFLSELRDPNSMPVFLTKINYRLVNSGTRNRISISPLAFAFRQRATLKAVTWWGVSETLRAAQGDRPDQLPKENTLVPNDWFSEITQTELEYVRSQPPEDICSAAFFYMLNGKGNLDYMDTNGILFVRGALRTENVCVTATGFPKQRGGRSDNAALITCDATAVLEISGLTLVGNNRFSGQTTVPNAQRPQYGGIDDYELYGFMPCLISTASSASDSTVSLHFARYGRRIIEGPSQYNYNLTSTNWHLMTNEGKYMSNDDAAYASVPTTDSNKMGPGFVSIFGSLMRNRRQLRHHWNEYRTGGADSRKSGVAGNFGYYKERIANADTKSYLSATLSANKDAGAINTNAKPEDQIPQGTFWNYELRSQIFKRNGKSFVGAPSVPVQPPGDDPSIMNDSYKYGPSNIQLGIKYAEIVYGLDYVRNYQSNARVYG